MLPKPEKIGSQEKYEWNTERALIWLPRSPCDVSAQREKASMQRETELLHGGRGRFKSVIHAPSFSDHKGPNPHVDASVTHLALVSWFCAKGWDESNSVEEEVLEAVYSAWAQILPTVFALFLLWHIFKWFLACINNYNNYCKWQNKLWAHTDTSPSLCIAYVKCTLQLFIMCTPLDSWMAVSISNTAGLLVCTQWPLY